MKRRQYDQYCPVAGALDIVGERWAMLIVRELLLGPKRFVDLESGLPGIGTNTLTTRLDELERADVVERRRLPAPSAATVYELTVWGRGLEPIVYAIARWGAPRLGAATPRYPLRATWLGTALMAFFRRDAVRGLTTVVELVLPTGTLALHIRRGTLRVTEGAAEAPALRITATEQDFVQLLMAGAPRNALPKRNLRLEGDAALIDRLVDAFPWSVGSAGPALPRSNRPPSQARGPTSRRS
jgi:DNA-binding HxlR family transcriptional regulator